MISQVLNLTLCYCQLAHAKFKALALGRIGSYCQRGVAKQKFKDDQKVSGKRRPLAFGTVLTPWYHSWRPGAL